MQKEPTPTPRDKRRDIVFAAIVIAVVLLDQLTKAWIRTNLAVGEVGFDAGFFEIIHVRNTGAAFGIFKGIPYVFLTLQIIAGLAILYIFLFMRGRWPFISRWPVQVGMALVLAGIFGNVIDRLRFSGEVTDFLNFKVWPVFNVADSSAVVGAIILAYAIVFLLRPELKE